MTTSTTWTEDELLRLIRGSLGALPFHEIRRPEVPATLADLPAGLDPNLIKSLGALGIEQLYSHQHEAIAAFLRGEDVAVGTGTSSGKSLCWMLPALHLCAEEPAARILVLYPTKALAQDQLGKLQSILPSGIQAAVYDGDTPRHQRSAIRNHAHIVLTNPDMLHVGILPQHDLWGKRFLRSLRLIVIDEAHTLRGVFGSHAAWVLRRLLRLCKSRPQVISCSATLPNIAEHLERLTTRRPTVISNDGSPQGAKTFFLVEHDPLEVPESPNRLTGRLLSTYAAQDVRTLAFCRARVGTELVVRTARSHLESLGQDVLQIEAYRGGYSPKERRQIEQRLFKGELKGVAATSAMEMGVDIGGLDVVLMNGYPGSLTSFWQQAGRSGRAGRAGAAIMIAHEDPLEHLLVREPELLFGESEPAIADPGNPAIASRQVLCATYESPLTERDVESWGPAAEEAVGDLLESGEIVKNGPNCFVRSDDPPAPKISLRGSLDQSITLFCEALPVGEMERWRALQYAHPGAVYLHRDQTYVVDKLNLRNSAAYMTRREPGYYTEPIVQGLTEESVRLEEKDLPAGLSAAFAGIQVSIQTTAFKIRAQDGGQMLDERPLEMPAYEFSTVGLNLDFPSELLIAESGPSVVHGLQHLLLASAPLVAGCEPRDLGSAWFIASPETLAPRICIYDSVPGGLGLAHRLYLEIDRLIALARQMVEGCPCQDGCPRCLLMSRCESGNEPLSKPALISYLGALYSQ